jgi:hypothetical protein
MSRSSTEQGADKAANLRRSQTRERGNLQNDISRAQAEITKLQEQRAPIASQARQIEAEVGPIKYIAALIYGDNPDANLLEKAVTWVIILIVAVFDPLAVIMLLAAQMTFVWIRDQKNKDNELPVSAPKSINDFVPQPQEYIPEETESKYEPDDGPLTEDQIKQIKETAPAPTEPVVEKTLFEQHPYLSKPFDHFTDTTPIVAKSEPVLETDFPKTEDNEAAEEAAKWAQEQIDDSKKKSKYIIKHQNQQIKKTKE